MESINPDDNGRYINLQAKDGGERMSMLNMKDQTKYALIDSLLDSYNENTVLYQLFGDLGYKERADYFLDTLRRYSSKQEDKGEAVEYF